MNEVVVSCAAGCVYAHLRRSHCIQSNGDGRNTLLADGFGSSFYGLSGNKDKKNKTG